jgi:nicotinamidase-related amidase
MGLKFLEKDERVPYVAEALEVYQRAEIGLVQELYKRGTRPALLVVDLQEAFISPDSPPGTKGLSPEVVQLVNNVVENTAILLGAVRKRGFPVVYTVITYREDGADRGTWGEKNRALVDLCKRGSRWVEVDKRVKPLKGEYRIEKQVPSGFIGTSLHQILTFNRVDTCIVTGLSISGCVRQTTIDAVSYGYYAVVPEECVGDRSMGPYKASLFDIMLKTADVASLEDVLSWVNSLTR